MTANKIRASYTHLRAELDDLAAALAATIDRRIVVIVRSARWHSTCPGTHAALGGSARLTTTSKTSTPNSRPTSEVEPVGG